MYAGPWGSSGTRGEGGGRKTTREAGSTPSFCKTEDSETLAKGHPAQAEAGAPNCQADAFSTDGQTPAGSRDKERVFALHCSWPRLTGLMDFHASAGRSLFSSQEPTCAVFPGARPGQVDTSVGPRPSSPLRKCSGAQRRYRFAQKDFLQLVSGSELDEHAATGWGLKLSQIPSPCERAKLKQQAGFR